MRVFPVLLFLAAAVACSRSEPVRIAVVATEDGLVAARLAAADIQAAATTSDQPIEVHFVNEAANASPRRSLAIAESIAADARVLAVVGHWGSARSLAASQVYNARSLPQIAPASSAPLYSQAGPYSFRLVAGDSAQGAFIASHIATLRPAPRVAIVYVNDDYGRALSSVVRRELSASGMSIAYDAPYLEAPAFGPVDVMAQAIVSANTSLLVWVGREPELRELVALVRPRLPHLRIVASDAVDGRSKSDAMILAPGDAFVSYVGPDRSAEVGPLAHRFFREGGQGMSSAVVLTYDATRLAASAIRAGARSRDEVRRHLESLGTTRRPYEGIAGAIGFDANGDASSSYVLVEVTPAGVRAAAIAR